MGLTGEKMQPGGAPVKVRKVSKGPVSMVKFGSLMLRAARGEPGTVVEGEEVLSAALTGHLFPL